MAGRRPKWFTDWAKGVPKIASEHAWTLYSRAQDAADREAAPLYRQFWDVVDGQGAGASAGPVSKLDELDAKRKARGAG